MKQQRTGAVISFDGQAGVGVVRSTEGERFGFHAVSIADATRVIDVGAAVTFRVRAGLRGWEAGTLRVVNGAETFACPVCGAEVPGGAGEYEICPRCSWEDDPVQRADETYPSGANRHSLVSAREMWMSGDNRV